MMQKATFSSVLLRGGGTTETVAGDSSSRELTLLIVHSAETSINSLLTQQDSWLQAKKNGKLWS